MPGQNVPCNAGVALMTSRTDVIEGPKPTEGGARARPCASHSLAFLLNRCVAVQPSSVVLCCLLLGSDRGVAGLAIMVQPKQGLSLLKFIPKAMRPQTSDVSSVALWGTTAFCGALWLVQPFDWIKEQLSGAPEEEDK